MTTSLPLAPGDVLKIERRYVVDGVPTTVTDQGKYAGVQVVGSAEHIALKQGRGAEVRLFPLLSVTEITLVKRARKMAAAKSSPAPSKPAWDPGVA